MVNKLNRIGTLLIVLTFAFVMTSCPDDNLPSGSTTTTPAAGDGWQGLTVTFNNVQVYEMDLTTPYSGTDYTLTKMDGELLSSYGLGNLEVISGKLNGTLGTPTNLTSDMTNYLIGDGIYVSDTNVKMLGIPTLDTSDGIVYLTYVVTQAPTQYQAVFYIYADRDVTISGGYIDGGVTYSYDMTFKQGWNTIIATESQSDLSVTYISGQPPSDAKWCINL